MPATNLLINPTDLLAHDAVSVMEAKRKRLTEIVDGLLAIPRGPKRWQAALKLYIEFNLSATEGMSAKEEVYYVSRENAQLRDTRDNKFAVGKDSDMRFQLNMPAGFRTFLKMVDPESEDKKNIVLIRKTFPMFVIAESY